MVFDPEETELRKVASAVNKSPSRLLTVIAEPNSDIMGAEEIDGLELISDEEKLMVVDMDTQDVEDPITPESYSTNREDFDGWTLFTVNHGEDVAARGRMAVVDDYVILDRIYTSPTTGARAWALLSPARCWQLPMSTTSLRACWSPPVTAKSSTSTSGGRSWAMCTSSGLRPPKANPVHPTHRSTTTSTSRPVTPAVRIVAQPAIVGQDVLTEPLPEHKWPRREHCARVACTATVFLTPAGYARPRLGRSSRGSFMSHD